MQLIKGWYLPDSEKHFKGYFEKFSDNSEKAEYQSYQRKISLAYVKESRVAIDIGANIGLWARDICEKFDQVHLFEPYEKNIDCLKKNLSNYNNYSLHSCCLSNIDKESKLTIYPDGLGANTLNPQDESTSELQIDVSCKRLDYYELNQVDYIKIDVQYHELEVIEGSIETLKRNNPVLCIEAARRNQDELNYVNKFINILQSLSYRIVGEAGKKELIFMK